MSTEQIVFGPFRFDPVALHLWRGEQVVAVQPKPLAVLRSLAARPGQVVTKKDLLKEVWAGTYVTQAVLKVAVRALREALSFTHNSDVCGQSRYTAGDYDCFEV
jgi:DNA-binding winged helix-turn-helix (wHTH) protein